MFIEVTKKDILAIVNGTLQMGGGNKFSELELALAKKCIHLYERVETLNEERNKFREALKSVYITCDKVDGDKFREQHKKNLECTAKGLFKQILKLNAEKENINGTPTATEDVHAQTNP